MLRKNRLVVFIVGLGQIGASLGYDLMTSRSIAGVIGYDKNPAVCKIARRKRAISGTARSIAEGIASADIIILATPIRETIKLLPLRLQSGYLRPDRNRRHPEQSRRSFGN